MPDRLASLWPFRRARRASLELQTTRSPYLSPASPSGILSPLFGGAPLFIFGSTPSAGFSTPSLSSSFLLSGSLGDLPSGVGAASGLAFSGADGGVWANDVAGETAIRAAAKIDRNKIFALCKSWRERTKAARQLWPIYAPHRRPTSARTRTARNASAIPSRASPNAPRSRSSMVL